LWGYCLAILPHKYIKEINYANGRKKKFSYSKSGMKKAKALAKKKGKKVKYKK
jgi:hypothetical protein